MLVAPNATGNPEAAPSGGALPVPSPPSAESPGIVWWLLLMSVALGALTWLAYANSFSTGLTLDSGVLVGDDSRITALNWDNLHLIATKTVWWPTYESDLYRPLTTFSYLVNYTLLGNGANPTGYHVVNFLLHWANACLVLVVLRRMTGRLGLAALAAALFAVHPVNTESVTNIVGRADLFSTLSILLSGWCYLRAADARGWRKFWWLFGTGLNACWGFYAKENAVMIAVFVLLYDWLWRWPRLPGENFWSRLKTAAVEFGIKGYTALVPMAGLVAVTRYILYMNTPVFGQIFVDNPIVGADSWVQAKMTAIQVLGRYLALLVFPRTLSADYSYNEIPLFGSPGGGGADYFAWLALAVIVVLLWTAFRLRRPQPLYAWGVFFFFLTILPTANLLFPIGSIMGERFLYLPSIGFCAIAAQVLLAAGLAVARAVRAAPSWQPGLAWVLPAIALILFGLRTHARNYDWQDNISLWESARRAAPESFKTWKGYGSSISAERPGEASVNAAIASARIALAILQEHPIPINLQDETVFIDLGKYYFTKGQYLDLRHDPAAREYFQKSADILARAREVDQVVNQNSRAAALNKGRLAEDIPNVGNYHIYEWLGRAYDRLAEPQKAEAAGRYIQRLQPQLPIGYQIAGVGAFNSGDLNEAAIQFLQALFLDHNNQEYWRELAICYARLGLNPVPINSSSTGPALNDSLPLVRRQINAAGVRLVQNFLDAKQFDGADIIRSNLIRSLKIPPELFDKK